MVQGRVAFVVVLVDMRGVMWYVVNITVEEADLLRKLLLWRETGGVRGRLGRKRRLIPTTLRFSWL